MRLLGVSLRRLGSDASVEVVPGRDHANILDAVLAGRLDREMHAAVEGVWSGLGPLPYPER